MNYHVVLATVSNTLIDNTTTEVYFNIPFPPTLASIVKKLFVLSQLMFSSVLWRPHLIKHTQLLKCIQWRAIKYRLYKDPST